MDMMIRIINNLQAISDDLQARSNELLDTTGMSAPELLRKTSELNGQRTMYIRITSMILAEHNASVQR